MLPIETLRSSTFRLALVCVAIFSGAVFALLGYVYWATATYIHHRSDAAIQSDHAVLVEAFDKAGQGALLSLVGQRTVEHAVSGGIYLLADRSFGVIAGNLKRWPPGVGNGHGWAEFQAPEASAGARQFPLIRAIYDTLPDGSHLLVGRTIDDLEQFVGAIRIALIGSAVMTLVLAATAGFFVTRRTVGRIQAINATTATVMRTGLDKRIPLRGTNDEWDRLAGNLNAMLDRVEASVREVKQVSDNVAHDLRTPLTRLRGRLEKAHHQKLDRDGLHMVVGDAIGELDSVLRTFSSLLRISRIEALDPTTAFRVVDLAEMTREVVELFDAAAEESGMQIKLRAEGAAFVLGDRDLLFEAISNVLDNAIKHGRAGDISVRVFNDNEEAVISVADRGPGIPPEERANVLRRFYRLEHSRSSPGNGLGLSLVAAVAQQHGASINMGDNAPGLIFEFRFPRVPPTA